MNKAIITIFILTILLIVGCDNDNPVKPITPDPLEYDTLIHLNTGNYWLYREYELKPDGSGGTPHLDEFGFIIDTTLIQSIYNSDSINYQMSRCDENLIPIDDSNYLTYGGDKLVYENKNGFYYSGILRSNTLIKTFNDLIFPYLVERGDSVSGHVFYYSVAGNYLSVPDEVITQYVCVSTDSLITTPMGDFNCIVYKMAYYDFPPIFRDEVYYFIKPGLGIVGMIQMVYHYSINEYWYIRKTLLTDYQIK